LVSEAFYYTFFFNPYKPSRNPAAMKAENIGVTQSSDPFDFLNPLKAFPIGTFLIYSLYLTPNFLVLNSSSFLDAIQKQQIARPPQISEKIVWKTNIKATDQRAAPR